MDTASTSLRNGQEKTERELRCEQFIEAISSDRLDDFYRVVVDAIPAAVLIMEKDARIVDYNRGAREILEDDPQKVLRVRIGEAMHCLHSIDVPAGCGRGPACQQCVIRNAVNRTLNGGSVHHEKARLELLGLEKTREARVLVTASPIEYDERRYALLILEEWNEENDVHGERESDVRTTSA